MAIDIFSSRLMLAALLQMKPPSTAILDMFFPGLEVFGVEEVDLDVIKGIRRRAPFVRPTEASKLMMRLSRSVRKYRPPYVKPKMVTTAGELLKRPVGVNPYGLGTSAMGRATSRLGEDQMEMWEATLRRLESMAAEAIRTGQVRIKGDGIDEVIDFLMPASHKITLAGTDLWTDPAADIIGQIRQYKRRVRQSSGLVPNLAFVGAKVHDAMENHEDTRKKLDNLRMEVGNIVDEFREMGLIFIGIIQGVTFVAYDEWYIDEDTGLEVPMIPDEFMIMGSTNARTSRMYGAILDDEALVPAAFFPTSWKEKDPPRRYVMLQSSPMPGFHQPDAFISVQAVA